MSMDLFVSSRRSIGFIAVMLLSLGVIDLAARKSVGCPFCSAVSQTFSEEMETMDVVVFAELVAAPPADSFNANDPNAKLPKAKFRIVEIVKGDKWTKVGDIVEPFYFGEAAKNKPFLLMGTDVPNITWTTPLIFNERSRGYLKLLATQPQPDTSTAAARDLANAKRWSQRLAFFQDYLEDSDEMLARDAYDEFAKAPYLAVRAMQSQLKHDQLLTWIQNPEVPSNRRRLYFTMLGVCANEQDGVLLEQLMKSQDRKDKAGLDALIACYLLITKSEGLQIVDELFFRNPDAEYADTYAAIMAIRFHGSEVDVIPKTQLVKSLRLMLKRPELADLVIPDLARWKDWDVMPELVRLFKEADENSSWVRVPVVNYLRVCPLPEAKVYIAELTKLDPEAVKRAQTFFPVTEETTVETKDANASPDAAPAVQQGASRSLSETPELLDSPSASEVSASVSTVSFLESTVEQIVAVPSGLTAIAADSLALVPLTALAAESPAMTQTKSTTTEFPITEERSRDTETVRDHETDAAVGTTRTKTVVASARVATGADRITESVARTWEPKAPNRWVLICVTTSIAVGLFWLQRAILGVGTR